MLHHYRRQPVVINSKAPASLKPRPKKLTPEDRKQIIRYKKRGLNSSQIRQLLDVSESAISLTWKEYQAK